MDLSLVFRQGDSILMGVFLLLLLMSLTSWCFILHRVWVGWRTKRESAQWIQSFWAQENLASAAPLAQQTEVPFARIALSGLDALAHYVRHQHQSLGSACGVDEFLVRSIRMALMRENARLESGLTWLATVGAVAPFVGLFGTVWGIYHALLGMGAATGPMTLATVSGPVGEALVATAAGLAAAIPAVVAYNAFVRANRIQHQQMDGFAHDLHAQLLVSGVDDGLRTV